jgi:hypothetical protein
VSDGLDEVLHRRTLLVRAGEDSLEVYASESPVEDGHVLRSLAAEDVEGACEVMEVSVKGLLGRAIAHPS